MLLKLTLVILALASGKSLSMSINYRNTPVVGQLPPRNDAPAVARYIVHNSNWGIIASFSATEGIEGYPFSGVYSVSDGSVENSTGVPYFYVTPLDPTTQNLEKDPRSTLSLTLAEGDYCEENSYDPEDPRCARVALSGKMVKVAAEEEAFVKNALFSRHPAMNSWPNDHNWYFAKLLIEKILLLDYFGGMKDVDIDKYFKSSI